MEYAQYAEIIKSAEATRRFVDAHVIPIVCHYFVDARMEKALEHVDVARVAGSTRYIEWFKTDGIKMVTEDNEAARQLRDQLFKTTYNAIVNQARRYPDIFNLRKTLNAGSLPSILRTSPSASWAPSRRGCKRALLGAYSASCNSYRPTRLA